MDLLQSITSVSYVCIGGRVFYIRVSERSMVDTDVILIRRANRRNIE